MLLCHTSLFTVKCVQVIEWSNPFSHSLSVSLPHFYPNSQLWRNVPWLMKNHSKLLYRTFHSQRGNWSFLLCILHLGPNTAALPTSLLSLTIKWWLILAYISIQLQYPFDFDAIDSSQNETDMFWFLMVNYDNSPVRMKLDNLFIYQSVTYRLFGECHALMALESFLYLSKFSW